MNDEEKIAAGQTSAWRGHLERAADRVDRFNAYMDDARGERFQLFARPLARSELEHSSDAPGLWDKGRRSVASG